MTTLTADFQVVTPMFLGDADQTAHDLRPPSLKGALRFWWRALHWAEHAPPDKKPSNQATAEALKALYAHEARLFGRAAKEENRHQLGGQGLFALRVRSPELKVAEPDKLNRDWPLGCWRTYLLGMGLADPRRGYLRSALLPGPFQVQLHFKPGTTDADRLSVERALLALGLMGNLGARARRGWGAVAVTRLAGGQLVAPTDYAAWRQALRDLLTGWTRPPAQPPFTAFSQQTRQDSTGRGASPWAVLETVGQELLQYRGWGRQGRVCDRPAEQNFTEDHDAMHALTAHSKKPQRLPQRGVFGLPHNYFFSSTRGKVDIAPAANGRARRASPLFIHIHRFADGSAAALQTLFPSQFLPEDDRIEVKVGRGPRHHVESQVDYDVITRYLDRFQEKDRIL